MTELDSTNHEETLEERLRRINEGLKSFFPQIKQSPELVSIDELKSKLTLMPEGTDEERTRKANATLLLERIEVLRNQRNSKE